MTRCERCWSRSRTWQMRSNGWRNEVKQADLLYPPWDIGMDLQLDVSDAIGSVSAIFLNPSDAWLLYVLAHGAGAGMRHHFLESVSGLLADRGIATLRYQFPYIEAGRKRPDPPPVSEATVRAAVGKAREVAPEL